MGNKMGQKAIVLINIEIGSEEEVLSQLAKIPNVKETYLVYGVYDIVAVIEANTQDELREIVVKNVRRIPKVRSTTTMMVIEEHKK
ncbi:MAG: Lrp/AsnC ligand binding domain-containing protein [Desulfurococcaceae archaeon]|nr:Lrp/AsnC ligand binding domain-containing protein [Desulfurococcaceae archaeon]